MNKTYTLIGVIVLVAGLSLLVSMAYTANKAKQVALTTSTVATSTDTTASTTENATVGGLQPKLHDNQNVSFSSPQQLVTNVNSQNQFIVSSTINGKTSFVEVYVGKTGDCYMDFCKAQAQSTSVQNGITWEFLGNPEHCDAKECSQPSALYRTKTATKDIYLAFFEYGPHLNKTAIFSTFVIK